MHVCVCMYVCMIHMYLCIIHLTILPSFPIGVLNDWPTSFLLCLRREWTFLLRDKVGSYLGRDAYYDYIICTFPPTPDHPPCHLSTCYSPTYLPTYLLGLLLRQRHAEHPARYYPGHDLLPNPGGR